MSGLLVALIALLFSGGCARRSPCERADPGCRVIFAYAASVDGKTVSSASRESPAEIVLGEEGVTGLLDGLVGAKPGERRAFAVAPDKAFGPRDERGVQDLPAAMFAALGPLKPGMKVQGVSRGQAAEGVVVALSSASVRLDFNHPLAGKTVVYDVTILRVEKARP